MEHEESVTLFFTMTEYLWQVTSEVTDNPKMVLNNLRPIELKYSFSFGSTHINTLFMKNVLHINLHKISV